MLSALSALLTRQMPLAMSEPTLCFLPHCPRSVNEALLRANWRPGELDRLLLVSNTFETYLLQCAGFDGGGTDLAQNERRQRRQGALHISTRCVIRSAAFSNLGFAAHLWGAAIRRRTGNQLTTRSAPHLLVTPLPHSKDPPPLMERAFADISFQSIRADSLPPADSDFWTLPPVSN